jgi:isopentenyl phosphate kinase
LNIASSIIEAGLANDAGCVNNSFHIRVRRKHDSVVVGSTGDEANVSRVKYPGVLTGTAFEQLAWPQLASASEVIGPSRVHLSKARQSAKAGPVETKLRTSSPSALKGRRSGVDAMDEATHEVDPDDCGALDSNLAAQNVELIVKIGGSAVTNKREPHQLASKDKFDSVIEQISRVYKRGTGMIICHGAGSFGHLEAREYGVGDGDASPLGVAATHAAVSRLSWYIVDSLVLRGVPAVSVAPLSHCIRSGTTGEHEDIAVTACRMLHRGLVPVIHGDAVYGRLGRTQVISADELVYVLAMSTLLPGIRRAVFVSDVDGLYTKYSQERSGSDGNDDAGALEMTASRLVTEVTVDDSGEPMWNEAGLQHAPIMAMDRGISDVTGGMTGKLRWAGRISASSCGRISVFFGGVLSSALSELFDTRSAPSSDTLKQCTSILYGQANINIS